MTALRTLALGLLITSTLHTASDAAPLRLQSTPAVQSWGWWRPSSLPSDSSLYTTGRNLAADQAPASTAAVAVAPLATTSPSGSYNYDAYVDMGHGPFASSSSLTGGGSQGWWNSDLVRNLYGHTPTGQEQASFTATIMQRVQQTFDRSQVPVSLTSTEGASAAHSVSVVSNANYPGFEDAVGIADVGGDGFSFIDKFKYASSVNDLQWAVAHNVAHELMHAFGGGHEDTTGGFLDTATISWDKLIDPNLTFGPDSAYELLSLNFRQRGGNGFLGAEEIEHIASPSPVPEPTTLLAWGLAAAGALIVRSRRRHAI